jgi:antitoxin component of MazEF toxin-antitoxin module
MLATIVEEGDSLGIVLNADVMELAQLKIGDEVNVEVQPDGTIQITPIRTVPPCGS